MSNQTDHTIVRLRVPPELKQKIEESAEKNNRSQSAEMVARLEKSFESESPETNERREKEITYINSMFQELIQKNEKLEKENELYNKKTIELLTQIAENLLNNQK